MKQDIKNNEPQERQDYVPASVEVIEVNTRKVLCLSGGTEDSQEGNTDDWWIN